MIYVIESGNYFKVGYTSNWRSRLCAYNTHCPKWDLVFLWNEDKHLENYFHRVLSKTTEFNFEWFEKFTGWEVLLEDIYNQYLTNQLPIKPHTDRKSHFSRDEEKVFYALSLIPTTSDNLIKADDGFPMSIYDLKSYFKKLNIKFSYTALLKMDTKYQHEKYFKLEITKITTPKYPNGIFTVRILDNFNKIVKYLYMNNSKTTDGVTEGLNEGVNFTYCQSQIEGEGKCTEQCEHCSIYYKPLEDYA